MTAGSTKVAGDLPVFIKTQPLRRPRNDRFGNRLRRCPRHFLRVVEAKIREFRPAFVPVNMRKHALVVQGLGADWRINDLDGDVRVFQKPAVKKFPAKIDDANAVSPRDRPDRSFPDADPPGFRCKAEAGEIPSDQGVLLVDVEIRH